MLATTYEHHPVAFKEPPKPLELALALELSAESELEQLEATVTRLGMNFVDMGEAIERIRAKSLFKVAGYKTFAKYVFAKWGLTGGMAQKYIKASRVYRTLVEAGYDTAILPPSYSLYSAWSSLDDEEIAVLWQEYMGECDGEPSVTTAWAFIKRYKTKEAKPKTKRAIVTDVQSADIVMQLAKQMDATPGEVIRRMVDRLMEDAKQY
ncbi:MAG: hypothetical protein N4J56_004634 [Chroococcidiopsis sp. SAG 2025]|uniref:hypothetical protein n=1 Tax=Chroococcidiopsis sp. SAG 2025 TaxID=171389 RepID=UPI0029371470|nr:hypothetical protein [Chroococcidiopsis sp. SAG 2025]MDV2994980.1 hypothetical protein [Chroococcidiopsis sp. SAG 2025]